MGDLGQSAGVLPLVLMVTLFFVVTVGGGVMLFGHYRGRARLLRRAYSVTGVVMSGHQENKAGAVSRRKVIQGKLKELEDKRRQQKSSGLRDEIIQAGLTISVQRFLVIGGFVGVLGVIGCLAVGVGPVGALLTGITMGVGLPRFILRRKIKGRLKKFTHGFITAIDVIVRGIRTGLPVGECLVIIGREIADPVGIEFRLMTEGQRLGMTLEDVLGRAVRRTPTPELKFFAIVLVIQKQTGGNLADTLEKLSDVLRERKKMRDKVQSLSAEAKASGMIIGALPFIVAGLLYMVSPAYLTPLFVEDVGHIMLMGSGVWMSLGILVMNKMINFEL